MIKLLLLIIFYNKSFSENIFYIHKNNINDYNSNNFIIKKITITKSIQWFRLKVILRLFVLICFFLIILYLLKIIFKNLTTKQFFIIKICFNLLIILFIYKLYISNNIFNFYFFKLLLILMILFALLDLFQFLHTAYISILICIFLCITIILLIIDTIVFFNIKFSVDFLIKIHKIFDDKDLLLINKIEYLNLLIRLKKIKIIKESLTKNKYQINMKNFHDPKKFYDYIFYIN